MSEQAPDPAPRNRIVWLIGGAALCAWFAMLWLMFGEVL